MNNKNIPASVEHRKTITARNPVTVKTIAALVEPKRTNKKFVHSDVYNEDNNELYFYGYCDLS